MAAIITASVINAFSSDRASSTQADAAKSAANTQADANRYAADIQYKMFQEQQALQKPWYDVGTRALPKLEAQYNQMPAAFSFTAEDFNKFQDPGYAFRLAEGNKALNQSAAARGGLISGNALKAAQRYGQEMGSQEFQNAYNRALTGYNAAVQREATGYNRLASLAGIGQTTAGQLANQAGAYGSSAANLASATGASNANALLAQGNIRASSYGGIGQSIGQGLQGLYNNRNTIGNWFSSSDGVTGPSIGSNAYNTQDAYANQLNALEGF